MKIDRRYFITSTMTLVGAFSLPGFASAHGIFKPIRFGIVTDPHYAERPPNLSLNRYYNESLGKLSECVALMQQEQVDFLIELGDFKDQGSSPNEAETLTFLKAIEQEFSRFTGPRYHVLGNHDHDSISKQQFLDHITNTGFRKASNYYSFNKNSFHFIVLDANYTSLGIAYDHGNFDWRDAHVPEEQLKWLKKDLRKHKKVPTIVFIHQRLDSPPANKHLCADNAAAIRQILDDAGNVLIVFQGHDHKGDLNKLKDIHYYTLKAVIEGSGPENNSYAIVEIDKNMVIQITGYHKTKSQDLTTHHL